MRQYAFWGMVHLACTLAHGGFTVDEKDLSRSLKGFSREQVDKAIIEIEKREAKFSADASWMYYPEIAKLIKQIKPLPGKKLQGAEIGVLYGGNTEWLLDNAEPDLLGKIYSIDSYDRDFFKDAALAEVLYLKTRKKLQRFGKRCELMRLSSQTAMTRFGDQSLDFVFIDGDHSYDAVRNDLKWIHKVRADGLLIGDDYHKSTSGVIRAVDEFCKKNHYKLNRAGNDNRIWWIQKTAQVKQVKHHKNKHQSKKKKEKTKPGCGCNK